MVTTGNSLVYVSRTLQFLARISFHSLGVFTLAYQWEDASHAGSKPVCSMLTTTREIVFWTLQCNTFSLGCTCVLVMHNINYLFLPDISKIVALQPCGFEPVWLLFSHWDASVNTTRLWNEICAKISQGYDTLTDDFLGVTTTLLSKYFTNYTSE